MKGHTIASRAKRRLELKARKPMPYNPQISGWMELTDANISWIEGEIDNRKIMGRTPWKAIEQRKDGKKTGLIALARVI